MDKILATLEEHVEKIVLGAVGLICLWLLVTGVLLNPNAVSFDGDKFNPGAIDAHIGEQARTLEAILNQPPSAPNNYEPRLGDYQKLIGSSITGVNFAISPPVPESNPQGGTIVRKYSLPEVGQVRDVAAGHIRAVVYAPFEEVGAERVYDSSISEPNDLDLVTVRGSFDVAELYRKFHDSFAGPNVKLEWRDPCLATPVFAAVDLERQESGDDGLWSDWQDVPRAKIDHQRELFTIIEDAASLPPGGLTVRMLKYSDRFVQMDLLQPPAYRIASAHEEWFPPPFYKEFKVIQAAELKEELRRQRDEEKEQGKMRADDGRRNRGGQGYDIGGVVGSVYGGSGRTPRGRTPTGRTGRSGTGLYGSGQPEGGRYGSRSRTTRGRGDSITDALYGGGYTATTGREEPPRPTVNDVYDKLLEISIDPAMDLSQLEEMVFWAHDDTVEPGKMYRYRIRLGVFNPVAGKNQLAKQYAARNNEVILWSDFSSPSEVVEIPRRLYFFAKAVANEAAREITVQVSKFMLGYWYSEDFKVKSGEVIGDFVENKPAKRTSVTPAIGYSPYEAYQATEPSLEPEAIDYTTSAVLVDVVPVNDWSGDKTMRPRNYFDMLYSFDGMKIRHMAIGDRYWPAELRTVRSEITNAQRQPKEPFRPWDSSVTGDRMTMRRGDYSPYESYDEPRPLRRSSSR